MMESVLRVADDRSEAELQPDILLPCQLGDGLFGAARLQPEKRLQLAVLEDAILTFDRSLVAEGPRPRRLLAEVDAWLASDATHASTSASRRWGLAPSTPTERSKVRTASSSTASCRRFSGWSRAAPKSPSPS